MKNKGGLVFLAVAVAIMGGMGVAAGVKFLGQISQEEAGRARAAPVVTVEIVSPHRFADRIEAIGSVTAAESVSITANVTETVRAIRFESGAIIAKGEILAELTSEEEAAAFSDARAQVVEAENNYERINDLVGRNAASRSRLDEVIALRDRARAQVRAIEARLADRLIRAPFDGVVGLRTVSQGALVRPGDVITTLDDIRTVRMDFSVPELFIASIKPGMPLEAHAGAYPDRIFAGQVSALDSRIDPATRTILIRALVPNDDLALKPGMFVTVELIQNQRMRVAAPELALVGLGENTFVFVVETGERGPVARMRQVQTGARQDGYVEVVSGLSAGDQLIVEGVHILRDRSAVQIVGQDDGGGVPSVAG